METIIGFKTRGLLLTDFGNQNYGWLRGGASKSLPSNKK